jgi:hypothetical protein
MSWRPHGAFLIYEQGTGTIGWGATLPDHFTFVKWIANPDVEGFANWEVLTKKLDEVFGDGYWIQWEGE